MKTFMWIVVLLHMGLLADAVTECKTKADIVFLVDSSTSIREYDESRDNWQTIKDFIINITQELPVNPDGIRIGVTKFSNKVDTEDVIFLGNYSHKEDLKLRINGLKFLEGGTNTSGAIRYMYSDDGMFGADSTQDRTDVQNFGILITDGLSNIDGDKTKPEARAARLDHKIKIFTVGITKYANVDELQEIASDPVSHYHYLSEDFKHLNLLIDDLLLGLCRQKPPPSAPCKDASADIAFVLDSSGSIGPTSWETLKQFVLAVVDSLDLSSGASRVAVVRYSTNASIIFPFKKYFGSTAIGSISDMKLEIQNLDYLDDRTNISGALRVMRDQLFIESMGDRPNVKNIGILISDGESTEEVNKTEEEAIKVKAQGIRMFALGLTTAINTAELHTIASTPLADHYFNTTNIAEVDTLKSRLIWAVCNDKCAEAALNPECWRNVSDYGCESSEEPQWIKYSGRILLGNNYDRLQNIATPEECQRLCFKDPQCRSIDYVTRYRQCAVSYVTKDQVPLSFVEEESADYYELQCQISLTTKSPISGGPTTSKTSPSSSESIHTSINLFIYLAIIIKLL